MSGVGLKKFFNTSGQAYKNLELSKRFPEMSEDEQIKLLSTDGMLVKRPILVGSDFVITGFKEEEWEDRLLKKEKRSWINTIIKIISVIMPIKASKGSCYYFKTITTKEI